MDTYSRGIHDNQVEEERTDSIKDERFDVKYMTIKFNKEGRYMTIKLRRRGQISSRTKD
jgi:hypothetical protein